MLPIIVLVMILQNEDAANRGRGWQTCADAFSRQTQSFFARQFRPALAAQNATILAAEFSTKIDRLFLLVNLLLSKRGIGMREIGRRAQHRDFHSMIGCDAPKM